MFKASLKGNSRKIKESFYMDIQQLSFYGTNINGEFLSTMYF